MRAKQYLCESWQGFLQYILSMMGMGYKYYQTVTPSGKLTRERWLRIDKRLIGLYELYEQNKDSRYHNKKRGFANFAYLRWGDLAIILKTNGTFKDPDLEKVEIFQDIFLSALTLRISENLYIKIGLSAGLADKGLTCYLDRATYRQLKGEMLLNIEHRQMRELVYNFNKLSNIPSYSGIIEQKRQLKKELIKHAQKHNVALNPRQLYVGVRRKMYTVFDRFADTNFTN